MKQNKVLTSAIGLMVGLQIRDLIGVIADELVSPVILRQSKESIESSTMNVLGEEINSGKVIAALLEFMTVMLVIFLIIMAFRL